MILKRLNVEIEATDKAEIRELMLEGFVPIKTELEELKPETADEISHMTVKELRALAEVRGIKLSKALKKQDIIDILEETNDDGR